MSSPLHPLEVDVIIQKIFKYVSLREIFKFRAVSQRWKYVGNTILVPRIKEIAIVFDDLNSVDRYLDMKETSSLKFKNFKFHHFPMGNTKTKQLLETCGLALKTLTLSNVSISSKQLANLLMNQATFVEELTINNLPKNVIINRVFSTQTKPSLELKHLMLYAHQIFSQGFLKDLFSCSPKLESLAMVESRNGIQEHIIFKTFVSHGFTDNLQKLKLNFVGDEMSSLLEMHLKSSPLEVFIIGYRHGSMWTNSFQTFINDHKDNWKHLEIAFHRLQDITVHFPKMNNLKYFSFRLKDPPFGENIVPSFGFMDYGNLFPNLVTLKLNEDGPKRLFNLNELFPESATSLASLMNLELPRQLNRDILRRVGRIFPNVCNLKLAWQPFEVLTDLWFTWPLIQTLAISIFDPEFSVCRGYGEKETKTVPQSYDSIFTGIPDDVLTKFDTEVDPSMITGPSISMLKRLRHLIIRDGPDLGPAGMWTPPSKITDVTFRFALNELTELMCLNIAHPILKVSRLCLEETCAKLELFETRNVWGTCLVKYEWQQDKWNEWDEWDDLDQRDRFTSFPKFSQRPKRRQ